MFIHMLLTNDYFYLAVVLLAVILITASLLIMTFFIVFIKGAIEESDDVYELCAIKLLRFKEGKWTVRVDGYFDDYSVLKLGLGVSFRLLFGDWELTAVSEGSKKGYQAAPVERNTKVYRRKVRRG